MDHGALPEAIERWHQEGLNPDLDPHRFDEWCDVFGLDRYYYCVGVGPARHLPAPYKEEVLAETEHTITKRHADGSIRQEGKPGTHQSIPHEIRPAVTTRTEWDRIKEWLDVESPLQSPEVPAVREELDQARTATVPVRLGAGSLLGAARNLLGFESFAMLPYDDPEWFEDVMETFCRQAERQIRYFGELAIPLDCIHFWEDICFKNGPIISPTSFREFALPRYRRIADLAASYGYDQISVDSDGNLDALLPLWLEGGVNFFWPLEVQAGMDINVLQEQYPDQAIWMGGIHKHRLTGGEKMIAAELERVRPAVERGGYIPALDHNCPEDVSFENYLIYLRLRHEILGLGTSAPERWNADDMGEAGPGFQSRDLRWRALRNWRKLVGSTV